MRFQACHQYESVPILTYCIAENCPSQRGEQFKAPCKCSGWMKMQVNNQTKTADDGKLTIAL